MGTPLAVKILTFLSSYTFTDKKEILQQTQELMLHTFNVKWDKTTYKQHGEVTSVAVPVFQVF